ncbi:uncharacterized protein dpr6 isoform X2 [Eurosta solidaginis]|uniref:uncharacterized protein dpr6 isoform X2 n=1 Tax=Eurosta solidaginis TaxID=178769 RepID=UPI003530BF33
MRKHNKAKMLLLLERSFNYETRWLLLLLVMCDMTNGGMQGPMESYNSLEEHMLALRTTQYPPTTVSYAHPNWMEPYFDPSTPRNVTALMGKSAYLSCRVRNLSNKTVSWIRHRDIHILTVGAYTYTSDQRFQATHHQDTDDWTLQIKWAQKRDAGIYECQISTQPVRSYFVRLNVVVPTASILGGPDLHVDKGSTINLTCTVKFSPEPPAYIFWYHHEEVINYDSLRGGVSVITEKGDVTTSFLLIQNADLADSGKYSCAPSNADVASVRVHVLNGEHPEAMQTGSSGCQFSWLTIFLLVVLVLCYQQQNLAMSATGVMAMTLDCGTGGNNVGDGGYATVNATGNAKATKANATCNDVATIPATRTVLTAACAYNSTTTITHDAKQLINKRLQPTKERMHTTNNAIINNKTTTTNVNGAAKSYGSYAIEPKFLPNNERNNNQNAAMTTTAGKRTTTTKFTTKLNVLTKVISFNNNKVTNTPTIQTTTSRATTTTTTTKKSCCCCQTTNRPTSPNANSHYATDLLDTEIKVQMSQRNCCKSAYSGKLNNDCNQKYPTTNKKHYNIVEKTGCSRFYYDEGGNDNNILLKLTAGSSDCYYSVDSSRNNNNNDRSMQDNGSINVR